MFQQRFMDKDVKSARDWDGSSGAWLGSKKCRGGKLRNPETGPIQKLDQALQYWFYVEATQTLVP